MNLKSEHSPQSPLSPEMLNITRKPDQADVYLVVPEDLLYFRGHFPGFAILPGVVQVGWAIQYSTELFPLGAVFASSIRVKFRKPIRPGHRLTLSLKHAAARRIVQFEYLDGEGPCASGQIGFAVE